MYVLVFGCRHFASASLQPMAQSQKDTIDKLNSLDSATHLRTLSRLTTQSLSQVAPRGICPPRTPDHHQPAHRSESICAHKHMSIYGDLNVDIWLFVQNLKNFFWLDFSKSHLKAVLLRPYLFFGQKVRYPHLNPSRLMFTCATDFQCDAAKPPTSSAYHRDARQPIAVPKASPRHTPTTSRRCHGHQICLSHTNDIANVKLETPPAAEIECDILDSPQPTNSRG